MEVQYWSYTGKAEHCMLRYEDSHTTHGETNFKNDFFLGTLKN